MPPEGRGGALEFCLPWAPGRTTQLLPGQGLGQKSLAWRTSEKGAPEVSEGVPWRRAAGRAEEGREQASSPREPSARRRWPRQLSAPFWFSMGNPSC